MARQRRSRILGATVSSLNGGVAKREIKLQFRGLCARFRPPLDCRGGGVGGVAEGLGFAEQKKRKESTGQEEAMLIRPHVTFCNQA